nr:retrovirus-related Pol polyprotein from transposon TNT 1-94 [Tanacetum cinerariifolium]
MRPFGHPVTILNTFDHIDKFDRKADEGFFVGYSVNSKAFRVFKNRTRIVEETLHITFLENKPNVARSGLLSVNASPYRELVDERLLLPPKQTPPKVKKQSCTSLLLGLLAQKECTDERDDIINIVSLRKYSSHDTHFNPLKPMKSKR